MFITSTGNQLPVGFEAPGILYIQRLGASIALGGGGQLRLRIGVLPTTIVECGGVVSVTIQCIVIQVIAETQLVTQCADLTGRAPAGFQVQRLPTVAIGVIRQLSIVGGGADRFAVGQAGVLAILVYIVST